MQNTIIKREIFKKALRQEIKDLFRTTLEEATPRQIYQAVCYVVKDQIIDNWMKTQKAMKEQDPKIVYYMSMEFLTGRYLGNNLLALTAYKEVKEALEELGIDLNAVEDQERDPALGNGGLGRLAACFLDSLSTLGYAAYGCGIRYHYGMFKQRIENGMQVEEPDRWLLDGGYPFELKRPEYAKEIRFGGDIMESDLDIKALYRTKASLGTLIADTTSVSTRRNVECGIGITEKLRNPRIAFSIDVPDLDPMTQARVQDALNSDDKVQKQFLSLLISGSFLPDEQSGIVNNSTMLNSTVLEIMASQLSNILQKLDIPIDLGLDYQQSASGNDIFDVAVSTELFNNRVIVNGVIGNRQYSAGSSNQEVVGDLDIEIKLDKPGAFRLKLFSHSADQYTNYLDNLQRNGVGLTYQQEYNTFGEFLRNLFTRKKNRPVIEAVEPEQTRIRIENPNREEVPETE